MADGSGYAVLAQTIVVHDLGINWATVGIILGGFAALISLLISIQERRNRAIKDQIVESVDHLSEVLMAKLETKETVAGLNVRIARLEGASRLDNSSHD